MNTIAFDKTGTLTLGKLEVCDIMTFDENLTEDTLLSLAASAEQKSEHPLGKAIVEDSIRRGLSLYECADFHTLTGKGISANVNTKPLFCGNEKFMEDNSIPRTKEVMDTLNQLRMQGKACILVADSTHCLGVIALSDVIRPEAKTMVRRLADMHTDVVLLTGDNEKTAAYFASQVGITQIHANLLPEEKVEHIQDLQKERPHICMIGDGVNDAPALKTASVGVAMGSMGSDIAVDAADIALMSDDISKIPYLKRLSNATVKTIKFSISLSMCINFVAVLCSVLGLLNPTTGALVHNAGSCFVVLIAALLYDRKFE